jgi:hypothetical protein
VSKGRKLQNEEHNNKCSSSKIFSITQSRRVRWDGLVAHVENIKSGVLLEDIQVFRRMILKPIP